MTARTIRLIAIATLATLELLAPAAARAQSAVVRYTDAQARDEQVRSALVSEPIVQAKVTDQARAVMAAYEALVRRYPLSGYCDNALFNAAELATVLFDRFGNAKDRETAIRLYGRLASEYPASSLVKGSQATRARLQQATPASVPAAAAPAVPAPTVQPTPAVQPTAASRPRLTAIERSVLPEAVRITLTLDREVPYREETLTGPARVFFDFKGVEAAPELVDAVLRYPADAVRQIRVGRHPNSTVRVVLDLEGVSRHTVYALYNPFRIVIDCEPQMRTSVKSEPPAPVMLPKPAGVTPPPPVAPAPTPRPAPVVTPPSRPTVLTEPLMALPARPTSPPESAAPAPEPPNANRAGGFSIARQLGLGVSRIVIDPGHGGHDPGAQVKGLDEADVTLDVALRLEGLLQKEPGLEVVLTRRDNTYVSLEERTAIANREEADLFLSIHANASRNPSARGVETYFLSFASSPEAEAVAARENSANAGEMRTLPDIIKTIALNNKLDESRDLAGMVQEALVSRLRRSNRTIRNLGVKKAPFVVLIGAGMPSVLAEVSFLTNKQELALLKNASYKQRIAEALHAAVMRYRRSLKGQGVIAAK